ncbi:vegetative cell wall protein gp1-like [Pyrus ussuriensis x Pyrus communis]|uniref:Vegetative cell wall protein gp1-like n=1 Tax=Pyrus ussuriensis x Pyrus communis TaxID=2448454 RepID=A0A5N5GWK7_9ROSA|nr:vegetative cell wall protein gp1-like [Pyrus x bretschneideri]KAB2620005.1 vegetative cell wall protein gp1-like [Pyrus ussuriensis x Pyrus communis]
MAIKMQYGSKLLAVLISMLLLTAYVVGPVDGDDTPGAPGEGKCGSCTPSPPPPDQPPPPPPPSPCPPPPPKWSPPSPKKPPSPKNPPSPYSPGTYPPPPPSAMVYITGPPGQLYPVDHNINSASRSSVNASPVLLGLLGILAFW